MTNPNTRDLEALMARLVDGDRSAFDPLYEELWPLVRRLTERMLGGAADAEDAAQETMTKLFARASEFESGRNVRSWVLAITAYECKTLRQKKKRRREHNDDSELYRSDSQSPEASAIARNLEAAALEVLGTLKPVDLDTIHALMRDERPDLARATFRKRLERALARLRTAWRSRHGTD